jgi:hypothetical protein
MTATAKVLVDFGSITSSRIGPRFDGKCQPLPIGSGGDPLRGRIREAEECATALGAQAFILFGPEPPYKPPTSPCGAGVSQDGGSGPWGPRALSPSRKRSVANGSGARSASVPPALSGPISAWTLG